MNSAEVRKHGGRAKHRINPMKVYRLHEECLTTNFLNNMIQRPAEPKFLFNKEYGEMR